MLFDAMTNQDNHSGQGSNIFLKVMQSIGLFRQNDDKWTEPRMERRKGRVTKAQKLG